jgi:4-oxalocrotonate tautomerase
MPLVQISVIKDVFTSAQKQEMIKKVTEAMVAVEGETMRGVTWVKVDEIESGDWAIGGQCLTTAAVKDLQAGQSAAA